ncbi:hypothetical protein RADP37_02744 [Roseomonas mucosa]|uniref:Uncharacterized protein n=1 Tax=Roseomonas mucosa TaxID=207340 RepID=A0A4Y1N0T7_9PROT|nr:hypothetical protein [Roseomonas mucosa]AWV23363.1 hypothetical protein RADP37_02744 [Roseomonas mucosa]MDT8356765.1 hypothetical protein [Roseomonas mucosa]MDU7524839.1 hypothetical protein [Roseomonas mucosa]
MRSPAKLPPAAAARSRLLEDQAMLRARFMRARLAEVSARFEPAFRNLLLARLKEASARDSRFAELAARLLHLPSRPGPHL